ncbi:actin [Colletotrichum tofieldiae]|nr:actin [Colletotrichum tofieldiae]GKT76768.1 actin [Colletotrichum tofieldiae]
MELPTIVIDNGSLRRARHPIEAGGFVANWEDAENVWKHVFSELEAPVPLSHPILMTEPTHVANDQRQRLLSHVFESLSAPAYYTALPALLSTYAANLPTALVVDSGFAGTTTVPVYEHIPIRYHARRNDVSGQAIDDWLQLTLMRDLGLELQSSSVWEDAIRLLKFERCRVAGDFEEELMKWTRRRETGDGEVWELPDGRMVRLDRPLGLWAGEILLNPGILGLDTGGLQHDVFNTVRRCDQGLRERLYGNILLAGGNTMFTGFGNRLETCLKGIEEKGTKVNVLSPPNRAYSAWVGGSMLSELATFGNMCISRAEYEEVGPEIVNRKCL